MPDLFHNRWWRKLLGDRGERLAARHLKKLGYRLVACQSRSFIGEIDLIALHGEAVVFVEVKTRSSLQSGHPSEAVDHAKQQRLTRSALVWLKRHRLLNRRCRFDVVAITWSTRGSPVIEHFQHAFEAVGEGQFWS